MKDFLIKLWHSRICNCFTVIALILIFMQFFYPEIVHAFLTFIFLNVGEKAITNIVNDPQFTTLSIGIISAILVFLKKKNDKQP